MHKVALLLNSSDPALLTEAYNSLSPTPKRHFVGYGFISLTNWSDSCLSSTPIRPIQTSWVYNSQYLKARSTKMIKSLWATPKTGTGHLPTTSQLDGWAYGLGWDGSSLPGPHHSLPWASLFSRVFLDVNGARCWCYFVVLLTASIVY